MWDNTKKVEPEKPLEVNFTVEAWAKIEYLVKKSKSNEISGFGVGAVDDPLWIQDFHLIKQTVGGASTEINGEALAQHVAMMAQKGIEPYRCMRVWVHSHPFVVGNPTPSATDQDTILNVLGEADWLVMVIVGSECDPNRTYAELMVRIPQLDRKIRVKMGVKVPLTSVLRVDQTNELNVEFATNVTRQVSAIVKPYGGVVHPKQSSPMSEDSENWLDEGNKREQDYPTLNHFNSKPKDDNQSGLILNPSTKSLSKRYMKKLKREQQRDIWKEYDTIGRQIEGVVWQDFLKARMDGFTVEEIRSWGNLITKCTPEQLRKATQVVDNDLGISSEDFAQIP